MSPHIPPTTRTRATSYFFILLLVTGSLLLAYSVFFGESDGFLGGLRQLGLGTLLIGIGEWINHPLQKAVVCRSRREFIFQNIRHRQRNPSALGNLFEIAGLLLLFTGLAEFL